VGSPLLLHFLVTTALGGSTTTNLKADLEVPVEDKMKDSLGPNIGDANHSGTTDNFSKDAELQRDAYSSDDTTSDNSEKQAGVKRIEAISKSWTTVSLVVAYVSYVFIHFASHWYTRC
jgi:hypothetical protein